MEYPAASVHNVLRQLLLHGPALIPADIHDHWSPRSELQRVQLDVQYLLFAECGDGYPGRDLDR